MVWLYCWLSDLEYDCPNRRDEDEVIVKEYLCQQGQAQFCLTTTTTTTTTSTTPSPASLSSTQPTIPAQVAVKSDNTHSSPQISNIIGKHSESYSKN